MSDNRDQSRGGYDPTDPWAPPNRDGVELSKPATPSPSPVHDQPTMTSFPAAPGGDVPPPPVAPGGPAATPGYGYPAATPPAGGYGYPTPTPPPAGGYGSPPAYGYGAQPGWGAQPANGMGTAGMVLGIIAVALFCLYGVPSLILGVLALIFSILGRKRVQRGQATNSGQTTAGIILGAIGIVIGVLWIIFWGWFIANYEQFEESGSGSEDPFASSLVVEGGR
ncbi:DUF4190 domain-containing protein [Streptomyces globisporus]|uniref:DUF4190 domain-containing protein n=1 Tax=Streptomyces globisporus TaxID=1908 RepID=UPI0004C75C74|nr:DUF4190 domain-containing protein [Streptomyces globisporus]